MITLPAVPVHLSPQALARSLILSLVIAGCKRPAATQEPIQSEPPSSASAVGVAVLAPPAAVDGRAWTESADGEVRRRPNRRRSRSSAWGFPPSDRRPPLPSACLVRGHVHVVQEVDLDADVGVFATQRGPVRGLWLVVAPDDSVPCRTPFDPGEKELRSREAGTRDLERSGPILVLGGARIAGALRAGAALCGWARRVGQPGLGYPQGWEGELADGSGALLGARAPSTSSAPPPGMLARSWRFSREGSRRRAAADRRGRRAVLWHRSVRVHHGGASAVSTGGAEVVLRGRDGLPSR